MSFYLNTLISFTIRETSENNLYLGSRTGLVLTFVTMYLEYPYIYFFVQQIFQVEKKNTNELPSI